MDVLTLLRREGRPMMPSEIARKLGKTPAGVRSRLCRLAQEGLVARVDGGYVPLEGAGGTGPEEQEGAAAPPVGQRCLGNARQRSQATLGNSVKQHQATVEGNGGQRLLWAVQVWTEAFNAVLGELTKELDQEVREELFAQAMLYRLKLPPENRVLTPEQALVLQTYALKQATELRLRLRPSRRRSELAWLLGCDGDDDVEPGEVQARFRRIRQRMELCAAEILERALR